ncbi:hypothetical protein DJ013_06805 [Arcticibacterium luteifluviistationis]|uniref:Adhesin domain-containing protein n=2 Tax=Arcticibacterium luteifluviistationis TaxID=1784714 RepID=A0A2Z4G9K3_9BACT|nr:hypothetical protein DJ013_06805 [Arcticibacterium luteifluviistationis]
MAGGGCINVNNSNGISHLIEKKKSISYSYKLDTKDPVRIENHFGDVKVKFWNKDEVKVNITITANAPTEEQVESFLKIVNIQRNQKNGEATFITKLYCYKSAFENNISKEKEKNFLRVDYQVYMPENHNLTVNNSHGDVYIPVFNAVLNVKQDYGNFFADHLNNEASVIDVNFGKAFIKSMTGGELKAKQTALLIDRVEAVSMTNTCGSIKVLEANNSDIQASYTKGYIGQVNESCKFNVTYSKHFKLGEIREDVETLKISSSYTNLELPRCLKGKYDLTADTKNTNMVLNEKPGIQNISKANAKEQQYIIGNDKAAHATKVHLTTNYGKVEVK